jgi:H+/Cl- antiporter ClcA
MNDKNDKKDEISKPDRFRILYCFRDKLIFEGVIIGVVTGIIIALFRYLITMVEIWRIDFFESYIGCPKAVIFYFIVLMILGYKVSRLTTQAPQIGGSGIPQVKGYLQDRLHMKWLSVLIKKFLVTLFNVGVGLSLGHGGPAVQLGATVGKGFGQRLYGEGNKTRYLINSGVSAGLAAVFNAPLAGVMFAMEGLHGNFSPVVLITSAVAAVSADFISKVFFGLYNVLHFSPLEAFPLHLYHYVFILSIAMALLGVAFNRLLLKSIDCFQRFSVRETRYKALLPYLLAGILALFLPQALGSGHRILMQLPSMNYSLGFVAVLLLVKFVFTMICYGSGASGGMMLPILALGGLSGLLLGNLFNLWFNLSQIFLMNIVIYAMLAFFIAIVRAPITGVILISEMTGSFQDFLPLAMVGIISYTVVNMLECEPLYDSLAARIIPKFSDCTGSDSIIRVKT